MYYKGNNSSVPSYLTTFTIHKRNNVHESRYSLRNKKVNIVIPQKEYLMRNVQYQRLELMSKGGGGECVLVVGSLLLF